MDILQLIDKDFVWDEVRRALPVKSRTSNTQYLNVNCPMCLSRGEPRADSKMRCGLLKKYDGFAITCFNCNFKTRFMIGEPLSRNLKLFMENLGIGDLTIRRLAYKAWQIKEVMTSKPLPLPPVYKPKFAPAALPPGAKSFEEWAEAGETSRDFLDAVDYVASRGEAIWRATTYYWTPNCARALNKRVIVPFHWNGEIVGWTGRAFDPAVGERYYNQSPSNFLFNNHAIDGDREYVIVVEGIFDALAIDGVGTEGAHLNEQQAKWLNDSRKMKIVVPDRDNAGQRLIDVALKNKWHVSFPRRGGAKLSLWRSNIKDVADAAKSYGRLYTLRTILEAATDNAIKIGQLRGILTE